jgi:membrane protein DedA with SNARE-associated domain
MVSAFSVPQFVATYGYPGLLVATFLAALGIGVPIPTTALLLALGVLSGSQSGPDFAALAVVALVGIGAGHTVVYWGGRAGNHVVERLLQRLSRKGRIQELARHVMELRYGSAVLVFLSRFLLTPIASLVSLLAGITRMPFGLYLGLEALGTAIYAVGALALGRLFGPGVLNGGFALLLFVAVVILAVALPIVALRFAPRWFLAERGMTQADDLAESAAQRR